MVMYKCVLRGNLCTRADVPVEARRGNQIPWFKAPQPHPVCVCVCVFVCLFVCVWVSEQSEGGFTM